MMTHLAGSSDLIGQLYANIGQLLRCVLLCYCFMLPLEANHLIQQVSCFCCKYVIMTKLCWLSQEGACCQRETNVTVAVSHMQASITLCVFKHNNATASGAAVLAQERCKVSCRTADEAESHGIWKQSSVCSGQG
jgi:hypothetical protein